MAYNFPRTMVLLASTPASASASIAFTSVITSNFTTYKVEIRGLVPATNNTSLLLTFSVDNGANYLASNYKYIVTFSTTGRGIVASSQSAANIILVTVVSNSSSRSLDLDIMFYNVNVANRISCFSQCVHQGADNASALIYTTGSNTGTTAINAMQFAMNSGNITSGTFNLYGISET